MESTVERKRMVCERKLAALLGIARRHLARWRMTYGARGDDWDLDGARVFMTEAGAEKAARALAVKLPRGWAKKTAADADLSGHVSVRVWRRSGNRKLAVCVRLDTNTAAAVQVRDNAVFRPGDEFEAVAIPEGLAYYGRWPEAGW